MSFSSAMRRNLLFTHDPFAPAGSLSLAALASSLPEGAFPYTFRSQISGADL